MGERRSVDGRCAKAAVAGRWKSVLDHNALLSRNGVLYINRFRSANVARNIVSKSYLE